MILGIILSHNSRGIFMKAFKCINKAIYWRNQEMKIHKLHQTFFETFPPTPDMPTFRFFNDFMDIKHQSSRVQSWQVRGLKIHEMLILKTTYEINIRYCINHSKKLKFTCPLWRIPSCNWFTHALNLFHAHR